MKTMELKCGEQKLFVVVADSSGVVRVGDTVKIWVEDPASMVLTTTTDGNGMVCVPITVSVTP
jgi:hypothetical protein